MKRLETMREQVRAVSARWGFGKEKRLRLDALDVETATDADVARIIGNSTWCSPEMCHECLSKNWDAVELGAEDEPGNSTVVICIDCLRKALALLEAPKE